MALAARDVGALAAAARGIAEEASREKTGAKVVTVEVDTGSDASVAAMVKAAVAGLGGVDILVNAAAKVAGQSTPPKLAQITDALFWDDVNVKVMGYLRCARAATSGAVFSVRVSPGCTAVTLMPSGPSSSARFLTSAATATLRIEPIAEPVCRAASPEMQMIRPQPPAAIKGATSRAQRR